MDVVVPCAACYSRFKAGEEERPAGRRRGSKWDFRVLSLLEFLAAPELAEKIKEIAETAAHRPQGRLLLRLPALPPAESDRGAPIHENPEEMDRLLALLGAEVIPWSYKTDCCGGSLVLSRTDIVRRLTRKLFDKAMEAGAEAIAVACPLCQSNLDSRQEEISVGSGQEDTSCPSCTSPNSSA